MIRNEKIGDRYLDTYKVNTKNGIAYIRNLFDHAIICSKNKREENYICSSHYYDWVKKDSMNKNQYLCERKTHIK